MSFKTEYTTAKCYIRERSLKSVWRKPDGSEKELDFSFDSAAFSPDGKRLATASADQTARVWELDGSGKYVELKGHSKRVNFVEFSPDGKRVATASEDHTARVWELDGSGKYAELSGSQTCSVSCIAACESCKRPCRDNTCHLACAQSCARCSETCIREEGRCPDKTCLERYRQCRKEYRTTWLQHGCVKICQRFIECLNREGLPFTESGSSCIPLEKQGEAQGCNMNYCPGSDSGMRQSVDPAESLD